MAINKIVYGDTVVLDLTSITVTADKMLKGTISHNAAGVSITGTYDVDPVSITVDIPPTKTSYNQNEALDLTGLVIESALSNGFTKNVTSDCVFVPADGTTLSEVGTITINVSYTENEVTKTTSFNVTVV